MNQTVLEQAFCELASNQLDALYRTALRMLHDHDEAEDAVQEALDKGWRNLTWLDANARLKPWLFRILTNTCLDHLRQRSRRQQVEFDDDAHGHQAGHGSPPRPDDDLHSRQIGRAIDQEINRLPEAQQAVVQLVIIEQFSYEDAATALDLPVGTVRSRLSRARASLSSALKTQLGETDAAAPVCLKLVE